jgi:uncharacterized protein (TIGR03067 family)
MQRLFCITLVGLLVPLGVAYPQGDAVKKEQKRLQGDWQIVHSEEDGTPTADFIVQNLKITIKGNQLRLKGVEDLADRFGKVTLAIDPSTKPKIMDFKVTAGKDKDNRHEGIYEFKGEQLTICVTTVSGGERPGEFKTKVASNRLLVTLKRAKQ